MSFSSWRAQLTFIADTARLSETARRLMLLGGDPEGKPRSLFASPLSWHTEKRDWRTLLWVNTWLRHKIQDLIDQHIFSVWSLISLIQGERYRRWVLDFEGRQPSYITYVVFYRVLYCWLQIHCWKLLVASSTFRCKKCRLVFTPLGKIKRYHDLLQAERN